MQDKDIVISFLNMERRSNAELTFTSLYMWRKALNTSFCPVDDCIILKMAVPWRANAFRLPFGRGDKTQAARNLAEEFGEVSFFGVTSDMLDDLKQSFGANITFKRTLDYDDYVYNVGDLINLPGKKYHSKKNHVNFFKRTFNYRYEPLCAENADVCTAEYEKWFANTPNNDDIFLQHEKDSMTKILANWGFFGLCGGTLWADGELCAFTISERLNEDTVVIHVEKARHDVRGAFAAINQMHLLNQWSDMRYVNREDDFGIEGLRRAKQSYHPVFKIEKHCAVLTR